LAVDDADCGTRMTPAGCPFVEEFRNLCPIMCGICPVITGEFRDVIHCPTTKM